MAIWQNTLIDFCIRYGFQVLGALVILGAGVVLAWWVGRLAARWLEKKKLELPLRTLIVRGLRLLVIAFTVLMALDKFGVQVAPLIAGIGVAGIGIGLAMQGVLGNVVAGLTIIFTKPFRVGEYVELLGVYGQVVNIELFSTTLLHLDQSRVVVPNRKIVGEILHNYGTIRQLDLHVGVAYGADLTRALATVRSILTENPRVLKEPAAVVGIHELAESAITLGVQPWVAVADYATVQLELYQTIVERFRGCGIEIPFPQREIRLLGAAPPRPGDGSGRPATDT